MDEVAVLRVLEAEQRPVRREGAAEEAGLVRAPEAKGLGRAVELARGCAVERHVHREPVAVADAGDDDSRRLREALVPAVRDALEERSRLAARERLDEPLPGLVAGLVLEPEDALAVERRRAVEQADGVVRDLPARVVREIPRVHLPHAGLVRRVHDPVGGVRRPLREEPERRAEASLPGRRFVLARHSARG